MGNEATQFKKGQSGNPSGRPKGAVGLVTKLRNALDKVHDGTAEQYDELLIQSIVKDAIQTDGQSRRLILQYLEGMPHQTTDVTSAGEKIMVLPSEVIAKNDIDAADSISQDTE